MFEKSGPVRSDPAWFRRTMGQSEAALWLNLSVRQIKRLTRAIGQRRWSRRGLRARGVPANRCIPASGQANRAVHRRSAQA